MAGSITWMVYEADDGQEYLVKNDKSNGLITGFRAMAAGDEALPVLPRYFRLRKINCMAQGGLIRRSVNVGTPSADVWTRAATTITLSGEVFQITSRTGEKAATPYVGDSGLAT